jgi:NADH:ubiquinone oxidoreductase subunit D
MPDPTVEPTIFSEAPDEAIRLALRRVMDEQSVSDLQGLELDTVIVNMGPQHPSTHGVLRLVVTLDGEVIRDVIPVIGYLHRCKAGIKPTRRAEFIRVIVGELMRIASHQVAVGTFVADLSPLGTAMAFYTFRDRERILDLLEAVSGARMMFNYFRFGGVRFDLPDGWVEKCREVLADLPRRIDEYENLVNDNAIFLQRCVGKGVITQQDVVDYAITGPNARASGVAIDLRRTRPYSVYPELDFDICLAEHGDVYDRYKVRIDEMRESVKLVSQALDMLPRGPVQLGTLRAPFTIMPPPGAVYVGQENPRGEYGVYVVSDGSRYPYRLKFRDPCFVNLQIFPKVLRGVKIADAIAISGSFDMVLGGIDR